MRRLVAVLVVSIVSLCAAPAIAAAPKHGYYIDPKLQVYVVVNASRTALSSFQAPCMVKDTTSGALSQSGGFLLKTKHPKLSPSGSFSYSGNVTLQSDRKSVVKVTFTGAFAGGKIKGKITLDTTKTGCEPYSYAGKYYGVNPQG